MYVCTKLCTPNQVVAEAVVVLLLGVLEETLNISSSADDDIRAIL